jgi:hypothetical protein
VSDFVELEEEYLLCIVWNYVGMCSLQIGIISRPSQDL